MPRTRIWFESAIAPDGTSFSTFRLGTSGPPLPPAPNRQLDVKAIAARIAAFEQAIFNPAADSPAIRDAGEALWACLSQHANAQAALTPLTLANTNGRELRLCIQKHSADAKSLPWEVLREANAGFLGADLNVPILREVCSGGTIPSGLLQQNVPLPVLAVIGAEGNDGLGEWHALRAAFEAAAPQLPLQVLVLAAYPALIDEITANRPGYVTVRKIPADPQELADEISDFGPRIAHFFCHGYAKNGGMLHIANASAEWGGAATWFTPAHLVTALETKTWVTVLNCCHGAAADPAMVGTPGTSSISERLVEEGVPAVVAMRGPMIAAYAHVFARHFHRELLGHLAAIRAAGQTQPLDLGGAFSTACRAVLAVHAGLPPAFAASNTRDWTMPVMTVAEQPLHINVTKNILSGRDQEDRYGELLALKAMIPAPLDDAETDGLAGILARIKELRAELGI